MSVGLLLGAGFGLAVCLLGWALTAPRPSLASTVARWERGRVQPVQDPSSGPSGAPDVGALLGRRLVGWFARWGLDFAALGKDLALTGTSLEAHLLRKCGYGLVGLFLPATTVAVLAVAGVTVATAVPAVLGLGLGGLLFWIPDLSVAQQAAERRRELRRALSCYLDLVAMSLAGGRGIPEAVPSAARIGSGWAFGLLQDTIDHARYIGLTPWQAFADLGERTGMRELQDLGGALLLVADDGAKIRSSLTARASTQRRRQLAEAEGAAAQADQSIQMAQVVLALGFFLFLGYPALVAVMGL